MKRTMRLETLLGLTATLALGTLANAQGIPPGVPLPGGAAPGAAGGTTGGGTQITNETTSTQTDTTLATDAAGADSVAPDTMTQTGGEPLILVMGGLMLAGGAFALRRKLA